MKKITFLMALVLIVSTINAQEARKLPMQKANAAKEKVGKAGMKSALREQGMSREKTINPVEFGQNLNKVAQSSRAVIFSEDFESYDYDVPPGGGWTYSVAGSEETPWNIDDGYWSEIEAHGGNQFVVNYWDQDNNRDAWIFSPAISLTSGVTYLIIFYTIMGYEPGDGDNFEVKIAQSPTASDMNSGTEVYRILNGYIPGWTKIIYYFTPSATGNYYLGFHAFTQAYDGNIIAIDDISVETASTADATIEAITAPVSGQNLTETEMVTATIQNLGTNPITSMSLGLKVDNGAEVIESYTGGNIASGATINYTFNATANLSADGNHTITVRAIVTGDGNTANDSKTITVKNTICAGITNLPLIQDFENQYNIDDLNCWTAISMNIANGPSGGSPYPMGIYDIGETDEDLVLLFSSYASAIDYSQYLISPLLPATLGDFGVSFDYLNLYSYGSEKFKVGYSTTTNNISSFTWGDEQSTDVGSFVDGDVFKVYQGTLPQGAKYFAIWYTSIYEYFLLVNNISITGIVDNDVPIVKDNNKINIIQKNGEIQVTVSENSTIRVLDISGRVFGNYNASANSTLNIYQPAGLYLFEVTSNSGVSTRKLIVK